MSFWPRIILRLVASVKYDYEQMSITYYLTHTS